MQSKNLQCKLAKKFCSSVGRQYLKLPMRLGLLKDALQFPLDKVLQMYVLLCLSWATKLRNALAFVISYWRNLLEMACCIVWVFLVEIEIVRGEGL